MRKLARRPVFRRLSIGAVGIGLVTAAATGGVAAAATTDSVPGTSCDVAQVERALKAQDPALYTKIMSSDDAQAGLEDILTVSKAERQRRWSQSPPATTTTSSTSSTSTTETTAETATKRTFLGVKGFSVDQRHAAKKAIENAVSTCSNY